MGSIGTKLPFRIAILECDRTLQNTQKQFGGYGGVFRHLLLQGADALKYPGLDSSNGLELSNFAIDIEDNYPNLEHIDAILLTGSSTFDLG
jgi:hypothetical protein